MINFENVGPYPAITNVHQRLAKFAEERKEGLLRPEVQWQGDGFIAITVVTDQIALVEAHRKRFGQ